MTATLASALLTASIRDNRIELRGPFNETLNEFYGSLPGGRWDKKRGCWTCHITPACCWRITAQAPCRVEAEEKIRALGHRFYEPVLRPHTHMTQPEIRNKDAWRHQVEAFHFAYSREASLLAMAMGTGKSLVTVQLAENWRCLRVLILCPVSVRGVWRREFGKHAVNDWFVTVLETGSPARKVVKAVQEMSMAEIHGQPWACVVNYETAKIPAFATWSFSVEWDLVVCDESHRAKGYASATSKYVAEVAHDAKRRLALTGTPMAHSPLDLFGQFRFLDRGIYGDSYHRFRSTFAVSGPFGADHIVAFKNQDELARRMSLITYQVGSEVLDLPEAQHIDLPFEITGEARRIYDEMEDDLIAFVKGGGEITAANGLVKLLRLSQITAGFCKLDDTEEIVELGEEKRGALHDLLSDVDEPVVVFCQFQHDLDAIRHVGESLDRRCGELSGRQKDLTPTATMPDDIDVLATQTQAGGVGVDLTRARICVFWNCGYSLGNHEQALARVHRPGQTRPVVYYHLVASNTVDEVVYKSLQKKKDVVQSVLDYLKGEGA